MKRTSGKGGGTGGESVARLNLDQLERLAAQLRDRPEELARLVRELALTTIDDLRDRLGDESERAAATPDPPASGDRGDD